MIRSPAFFLLFLPSWAASSTLPPGYQEVELAKGLSSPSVLAPSPDGRIFIVEQGGAIRIFKEGALLAAPFAQLPAESGSR